MVHLIQQTNNLKLPYISKEKEKTSAVAAAL
jgi:hypothetical protein